MSAGECWGDVPARVWDSLGRVSFADDDEWVDELISMAEPLVLLAAWLRAAADGAPVPRINTSDPLVIRVLMGTATAADTAAINGAVKWLPVML